MILVIPGREKRQPGMTRFPDVQLHIGGLVQRTIPERPGSPVRGQKFQRLFA